MAINNSAKVKDLVDVGMENDFPESDEINDFLPQESFSPEDVEDVVDFLSGSNIDMVETIEKKIGSGEPTGERLRSYPQKQPITQYGPI